MLKIKEVADYCSVAYSTAREWILKGDLKAYKFGSSWRIEADDLESFLKKKKYKGGKANVYVLQRA